MQIPIADDNNKKRLEIQYRRGCGILDSIRQAESLAIKEKKKIVHLGALNWCLNLVTKMHALCVRC